MAGAPDPKPTRRKGNRPRRIVDPAAVAAAKRRHPRCMACGRWSQYDSGHHIIPKDKGGDDVEANIGVLCGSGTSRCHGAHHGNPYVEPVTGPDGKVRGERRDAEWVNSRVLRHLLTERPDALAYADEKTGGRGTLELTRIYGLVVHVSMAGT